MSAFETEMGERIAHLRGSAGWSQSAFARRLGNAGFVGPHQTTISRIEQGIRPVSVQEGYVIADVLGVTLDDLSGREAAPTTGPRKRDAVLVNAAIDDAIEFLQKAKVV